MKFDFKNASKEELKVKYAEIAKKLNDNQFFTKKELNYLPEILTQGEQVLAFSSGLMEGNTWLITLTDKRIIFLDKGILYGLEQVIVNLDRINAVSGKTGLFFGDIFIEDGTSQRKIENVTKSTVKIFTNMAMEAMEAIKEKDRQPQERVIAVEENVEKSEIGDPFEKLEKLAGLRDRGIVSDEEFNTAKMKLLSEL